MKKTSASKPAIKGLVKAPSPKDQATANTSTPVCPTRKVASGRVERPCSSFATWEDKKMQRSGDLKTMVLATRQAMGEIGWDRLDIDRDEPSFESVCYVAMDALLRLELAHLSIKGASQISLFVEYLLKFAARRKADIGGVPVSESDKLNAYFCATELFNSIFTLSAGGIWLGVDEEMRDGSGSPDVALFEWMDDSLYFAEEAAEAEVGLDDIVCALNAQATSKEG